MRKILVPVDGSEPALRAAQYALRLMDGSGDAEIHLLNVQTPVPGGVYSFISADTVRQVVQDEAEQAMRSTRALLDASAVPYVTAIRTGAPAMEIVDYVQQQGCEGIVMGTRGMGRLGALVLGSVATTVVQAVQVPVTLVK